MRPETFTLHAVPSSVSIATSWGRLYVFGSASYVRYEKTGDRIAAISRLVPGAGLEPARP